LARKQYPIDENQCPRNPVLIGRRSEEGVASERRGNNLTIVFLIESQDQNLALTVLHALSLLESGRAVTSMRKTEADEPSMKMAKVQPIRQSGPEFDPGLSHFSGESHYNRFSYSSFARQRKDGNLDEEFKGSSGEERADCPTIRKLTCIRMSYSNVDMHSKDGIQGAETSMR